jgi:sirohydrochlorin ferrochelatase
MHASDRYEQAGGLLLARATNAVVRVRLLRDVLGRPPDDPQLGAARSELLRHPHVAALARDQLPDGSWGRFHSRDSSRSSRLPTSEIAIRRALALGLDRHDSLLANAVTYMAAVLEGRVGWTDRAERSEGWPIVVETVTAGTLAQVDASHRAIDAPWAYWAEVADRSLVGGTYDPHAEARAHRDLRGRATVYLGSRYALALLAARGADLLASLDRRLARWTWERPEGIGYLGVDLRRPTDRRAAAWLESLEILAGFRSGPEVGVDAAARLWLRAPDATWDFGPRMDRAPFFPLSDDWRGSNRALDCSVQVLAVLRRLAR